MTEHDSQTDEKATDSSWSRRALLGGGALTLAGVLGFVLSQPTATTDDQNPPDQSEQTPTDTELESPAWRRAQQYETDKTVRPASYYELPQSYEPVSVSVSDDDSPIEQFEAASAKGLTGDRLRLTATEPFVRGLSQQLLFRFGSGEITDTLDVTIGERELSFDLSEGTQTALALSRSGNGTSQSQTLRVVRSIEIDTVRELATTFEL